MDNKENRKFPGLGKRAIQTMVMTLACVLVGIVIAMQYKTMNASKDYSQAATITEYQSQIINLSNQIDLLKVENDQLQAKIDTINSGTNEEQIATLQKELDDLKKFAGLSTVTGEGVHLTINFPEDQSVGNAFAAIQLLVNEIKACYPQAMSINGQRIVAMSEIRAVSNYNFIIINGETCTMPLDIFIIGKQSNLNSMLNMAGGPVSILEKNYKATVEIKNESEITIGAYTGQYLWE
ncbi:MAG: DUF881 domain-containing protein [Ruminococcaceae bacterium]|nr:DUF881 domain-containing protein [Oscillospiraceae bacterium]